jgi:hypothetical protein
MLCSSDRFRVSTVAFLIGDRERRASGGTDVGLHGADHGRSCGRTRLYRMKNAYEESLITLQRRSTQ